MTRKEYTQKDMLWTLMGDKDIKKFTKIASKDILKNLEKIKKIKAEDRNFANTMIAYEHADMPHSDNFNRIGALSYVAVDKKVRDASRDVEVEFGNFLTSLAYDESIYKMFKDYYDGNYQNEKDKLETEDIKLVEDTNISFKRIGFHLPSNKKKKLQKIDEKINSLASKYDANLAEDKSFILCTEEEIVGLPENIKSSLAKVGNKYKVTMAYPEWGPFMQYVDNREKRKEMHIKFSNVAHKQNVKILDDLIKIRMEKAQILDYTHHADYVTETRMAKNAANVYAMQDDLLDKFQKLAKEDLKEIAEFAKKDKIKKLESWDTAYYADKIAKEKYAVDSEELRQYFQLDHVQAEMFKLFGDLFGFEVTETKLKSWHKEAKTYKVSDSKNKNLIGYITFDLYPREGKYGHACMVNVIHGHKIDEKNYQTPYAVVICNFSRAMTDKKKKIPSLLTVREVETLFHEFGHALHQICGNGKHAAQSGTNVAWDFVETPSQLMEEWVSDEKVLTKISKHYETGKPLSKEMIAKLKAMSKFGKGVHYTRQLVQGKLDMDLYTGNADNAVRHFHSLMNKYLLEQDKEIVFVSRFAHIARGYDAGYYSYIWAERIVKNIFAKFKEVGIFDKKLGAKYRKEILERGSSRDENESAEAFLGHPVKNEIFVESIMK